MYAKNSRLFCTINRAHNVEKLGFARIVTAAQLRQLSAAATREPLILRLVLAVVLVFVLDLCQQTSCQHDASRVPNRDRLTAEHAGDTQFVRTCELPHQRRWESSLQDV